MFVWFMPSKIEQQVGCFRKSLAHVVTDWSPQWSASTIVVVDVPGIENIYVEFLRKHPMRREKLIERFSELSIVLESGRSMKTDKVVILNDAVRILKRLKSESYEYTEMNERLMEEIKILKKSPTPEVELSLVMFNAHGSYNVEPCFLPCLSVHDS